MKPPPNWIVSALDALRVGRVVLRVADGREILSETHVPWLIIFECVDERSGVVLAAFSCNLRDGTKALRDLADALDKHGRDG